MPAWQALGRLFHSSLVLVSVLSTAVVPAVAQDEELETVIVTATRRNESLQSVASSVSAVTGNVIDDLGARDVREIMSMVPGLAIVTGGDTKYIVRGVSTDTTEEQRPATAEYLDETPITNPGGVLWSSDTPPYLIDMDRVEVLRGPQGTLFGSSSMGGTIRYITRRPSMDRGEGWVQFGASTTAHGGPGWSTSAMFNAPLQDGVLALRGVGFYDQVGGYIDNIYTGANDVNDHHLSGGRLALEWRANDQFTAITRVAIQRQNNDGTDQRDLANPPYSQTRVTHEEATSRWIVANVDIDYSATAVTVHSTTSWTRHDHTDRTDATPFMVATEALPIPLAMVNGLETKDFIQEIRTESRNTARFDWLAGVYFHHRDNVVTQSFPAPGFDEATGGAAAEFGYPDNLYVTNLAQPVDELSGYGEVGWLANERWRISAGARWFRFERTEHEASDGLWNGGPTDRSSKATESNVSPRYSISYKPTADRTYYAVVSNGYRPGGPNMMPVEGIDCSADLASLGYDSGPLSFKSDELWNYEVGARQTWREGRLSAAGAVYHIDWSRLQTMVFLNCGWSFVQNAGKARNDGIELELSYLPAADIDLRLAGSYVDARFQTPVPGLSIKAGDQMPGVPDLSGSVSARWRFLNRPALSASIHGLWSYTGDRYASPNNLSRLRMDGYDTLNLTLQINGRRWMAALAIDNVFDSDGVVFLSDTVMGAFEVTVRPRTPRLTFLYEF